MVSRVAEIFSNLFGRHFKMATADNIQQTHFHNLPPELLNIIFGHLDATALARSRAVCAYWRNTIDSIYPTRLEMGNHNWESFVKMTTVSKIHLKLNSVQFPIYLSPEFGQFMSRVNNLEITGNIPEYNVVNILDGCRKVQSVTISYVSLDDYLTLSKFNISADELVLEVTKLNIGMPKIEEKHDLLLVTDHVCHRMKFNCLREMNLSSLFNIENVLRLLFPGVLDQPLRGDFANIVMKRILDEQCQSLQLITVEELFGRAQSVTLFIRFHRYASASESSPAITNSTNQRFQIVESCLFNFEASRPENRQRTRMALKIFATQLNMKNLVICYTNEEELEQIGSIIKNNCATLEEIRIGSLERVEEPTHRSLSCSWFAACLALKKLTLCSEYKNRRVKLLDLLLLPSSLKTLSLTGFIPTGSSELFDKVTEPSQFPNLTEVSLGLVPWLIQDGYPVTVFGKMHLRWLLNLFPKTQKLTLKGVALDEFVMDREAVNAMGLENFPEFVSPEFVTWCNQGGGDNVKIDSFQTLRNVRPRHYFHHVRDVNYQMLIGTAEH